MEAKQFVKALMIFTSIVMASFPIVFVSQLTNPPLPTPEQPEIELRIPPGTNATVLAYALPSYNVTTPDNRTWIVQTSGVIYVNVSLLVLPLHHNATGVLKIWLEYKLQLEDTFGFDCTIYNATYIATLIPHFVNYTRDTGGLGGFYKVNVSYNITKWDG